jgi:glycosyltransferase involved in cell wall biosynthesis
MALIFGICKNQLGINVQVDWAGRVDCPKEFKLSKESIQQSRILNSWRWIGQRDDIAELMHDYDGLILPSLWEGFPNVICEALSEGLPVLASNVSDNPILIQNGITGFLFEPREAMQIALSIARFASMDKNKHYKMKKAAREYAEKNLSSEIFVESYEKLLMQL